MAIIRYARGSPDGQHLEAQQEELGAAGATTDFHEKVSRIVTERAVQRPVAAVQAGEVLLVTRLDRLARSTRDLLNILEAVRQKEAGFRSLRDVWADTTTAHGRLMLAVLGGSPSSSES